MLLTFIAHSYSCHLQSHIVADEELIGVLYNSEHRSLDDVLLYLSTFNIQHAVVFVSAIQNVSLIARRVSSPGIWN